MVYALKEAEPGTSATPILKKIIQEKCGVVGFIGQNSLDLIAFQAAWEKLIGRGTDTAGVAAWNGHAIEIFKDAAAIPEFFTDERKAAIAATKSTRAIAHNRYATSEGLTRENIQPIIVSDENFSLILAHNGNLIDSCVKKLRRLLTGVNTKGMSDSVLMAHLLLRERNHYHSWEETLVQVLPEFEGAFSILLMTEDGTIFVIKDPWAIRPLVLGQTDNDLTAVIASESVSLRAAHAAYNREILPGEIKIFRPNGSTSSIIYADRNEPSALCSLEVHYLAQPESYLNEGTMAEKRHQLGKAVGKRFLEKNIPGTDQIDFIVPILNSGLHAAQGVSEETGIPVITTAIERNPKARRSYIVNNPQDRKKIVHEKHIINGSTIEKKHLILVDDSLVRGTSIRGLIEKINLLGVHKPASVHLILGSPPVVENCDLGVVITKEELLAARFTAGGLTDLEKKVAEALGVNSVTFSTVALVRKALGDQNLCDACFFQGQHPIHQATPPLYRKDSTPALKKQKVTFMASGSGTNVQALLEAMNRHEVLAQPLEIISNNSGAGVIQRAENYQVPTHVFESIGKTQTPANREQYFAQIIEHIIHNPAGLPEVIVLAGWNLIIADNFLEAMQKHHISVINIHPALLSGLGHDYVRTSHGLIPEIRGDHAIDTAYEHSLEEMPVTGVTVHEVNPNSAVDTGKILIKQEVSRRPQETLAELEQRIHTTEYQIFSIALQKVLLHKLNQVKTKKLKK